MTGDIELIGFGIMGYALIKGLYGGWDKPNCSQCQILKHVKREP